MWKKKSARVHSRELLTAVQEPKQTEKEGFQIEGQEKRPARSVLNIWVGGSFLAQTAVEELLWLNQGPGLTPLKPFLTYPANMNKAAEPLQIFRYSINQFICERSDKHPIAAWTWSTLANRWSHQWNSKFHLHLHHKSLTTSFITFRLMWQLISSILVKGNV